MLAAIVVIYIVLGVLYESYIHPITILSTPALRRRRRAARTRSSAASDMSLIALIGIILLIGIVKKNAIMMIDFALDAERNEGLPPEKSIYQACLLRFRPDHDDDDGRAARRAAAGAGERHRLRAAQAAGHRHRRRPAASRNSSPSTPRPSSISIWTGSAEWLRKWRARHGLPGMHESEEPAPEEAALTRR